MSKGQIVDLYLGIRANEQPLVGIIVGMKEGKANIVAWNPDSCRVLTRVGVALYEHTDIIKYTPGITQAKFQGQKSIEAYCSQLLRRIEALEELHNSKDNEVIPLIANDAVTSSVDNQAVVTPVSKDEPETMENKDELDKPVSNPARRQKKKVSNKK